MACTPARAGRWERERKRRGEWKREREALNKGKGRRKTRKRKRSSFPWNILETSLASPRPADTAPEVTLPVPTPVPVPHHPRFQTLHTAGPSGHPCSHTRKPGPGWGLQDHSCPSLNLDCVLQLQPRPQSRSRSRDLSPPTAPCDLPRQVGTPAPSLQMTPKGPRTLGSPDNWTPQGPVSAPPRCK